MKVNMEFIMPLLKHRFTHVGQLLEYGILDYLGHKYYKGNRVTWEAHRRAGYKMYHKGCTANEIASRHKVPGWVASWWIEIWEKYDNAWSPAKYN